VKSFSDYDPELESFQSGLNLLSTADILIGHNIAGYDLPVLKKLYYWQRRKGVAIVDTWILSLLVRYKRDHLHGLGGWGVHFGQPKVENELWDAYSPVIRERCEGDVALNVRVYEDLAASAKKIIHNYPLFAEGMRVEMEFAAIEADIQNKGWVFDMPGAVALLEEIDGKMGEVERVLEPKLGMRCKRVDGVDDFKKPAWRKDGCYTVTSCSYFGITPERGKTDRPIEGPYSRVAFEQVHVGQIDLVKDYLYSIGWVPDEWNYERVDGKFIKKSPKLTESSLEGLGEEAMMLGDYYSLRARHGVIKGWIEAVEGSADGRLHGNMWTIGTPTFRCRHEVIANLPKVKQRKDGTYKYGSEGGYGIEQRGLLMVEPGCSLVGADSAGNQMRGLCHYIGDESFTNEVINGDVHSRNAATLSKVHACTRDNAKPWLYAYLFGAGMGKLGTILTGKASTKVGSASAELFESSIPGLKRLRDSLDNEYTDTKASFGEKYGHIRGIDGRIVFLESPHKSLNYLLQTLEGVTCKAAIVWLKEKLDEEGIHYYFPLHYHDELVVACKDEDAERVSELAVLAFQEAPKKFGVMCMNGAAKIGKKYAEVH
jgi:DNA polymerase-1